MPSVAVHSAAYDPLLLAEEHVPMPAPRGAAVPAGPVEAARAGAATGWSCRWDGLNRVVVCTSEHYPQVTVRGDDSGRVIARVRAVVRSAGAQP